jgi:type VII secretion-associated serine protease mycosin
MTGAARRLGLATLVTGLAISLAPAPALADPVRDAQWHVDFLDLPAAHRLSRGAGVTVAVIDSGVDASHPDLRDNLLPGVDLVDPDNPDAWTPEQHGTLVAGVLAGHGHGPGGGDGVLGIAPDARLFPVRVSTDDQDEPTGGRVADGIRAAVAAGAGVISISLSSEHSDLDQRAVEAARRADVVVIAAAGNRPDAEGVTFPAALPTVVAVGGVDREGEQAGFSVAGPEIALTAPGEEITTTGPGNEYLVASGTSLAAPVVAGAAALVRSAYPDLTADQVIHRLVATATDAGPPGRDERYGHGIVNPAAALAADLAALPPGRDEPDQIRLDQWHLESLDLASAHEVTRGDRVTVGLIGGGVDATHPDLHRNLLPGVDLAEPGNPDAGTPTASGTALAGIIAGHGNRLTDREPGNRGVLGIAPAATILPIRVAGPDLTDRQAIELAADGIERAVAGGARVICYAAGRASQDVFAEVVAAARAADVVIVAAAGDRPGPAEVWFPAANPAVVAAVAVDRDGEPAADSVTGPELTLAAPAVELVTTAPEAGYTEAGGSAAAAAVIAGAAALVRSAYPDLTADQVIHRLVATATDAGPAGRDERYGYGVLDLVAAVTADVPPATPTGEPDRPGAAPPPDQPDLGRLGVVVLVAAASAVLVGIAMLIGHQVRERRQRPGAATVPAGAGTPEPGTPEPGTPEPGTPEPGTPEDGTAGPGEAAPGPAAPGGPGPGAPDPPAASG